MLYAFTAVARIALVKPDKARGVENMILQAAQQGRISEKARTLPAQTLHCLAINLCWAVRCAGLAFWPTS